MSCLPIKKCLWLIRLIYENQPMTFEEIKARSAQSEECNHKAMPWRTFQFYRKKIATELNLKIECDRSTNTYNISQKAMQCSAVNITPIIAEDIQNRVLHEDTEYPENFAIIVGAIRSNQAISFDYGPDKIGCFYPYFLKQHLRQWYVFGPPHNEEKTLNHYALSDITSIEVEQDKHFNFPKDLSPDEIMNKFVGIDVTWYSREPQDIEIISYDHEKLRLHPIHHSQKQINKTTFRYHLVPNEDFYEAALVLGDVAIIKSPEECKNEMGDRIKKIAHRYWYRVHNRSRAGGYIDLKQRYGK